MTDPQQGLQLQVACGTAPGPDGQPWVVLSLGIGLGVTQFLLPDLSSAGSGPYSGPAVPLDARPRP